MWFNHLISIVFWVITWKNIRLENQFKHASTKPVSLKENFKQVNRCTALQCTTVQKASHGLTTQLFQFWPYFNQNTTPTEIKHLQRKRHPKYRIEQLSFYWHGDPEGTTSTDLQHRPVNFPSNSNHEYLDTLLKEIYINKLEVLGKLKWNVLQVA